MELVNYGLSCNFLFFQHLFQNNQMYLYLQSRVLFSLTLRNPSDCIMKACESDNGCILGHIWKWLHPGTHFILFIWLLEILHFLKNVELVSFI